MLTTAISGEKRPIKKIINVISLDYDGCLANINYKKSKSPDKLLETNKPLFKKLRANVTQEYIDEVVFMIGSSRQDFYLDNEHFERGNGSCFPVYNETAEKFQKIIGNNIPCRVDGYLLADTFGKRKCGENFKAASTANSSYPFSTNPPELSKLPILYAQMHKLAAENPDATIIYDFYDDKNTIYQPLHQFFTANPTLIPHNTTLRIHGYAGTEVNLYDHIIQGTGTIQADFEENVMLMYQLTNYSNILESAEENLEQCNILSHLQNDFNYHFFQPSPLEQFKQWTQIKHQINQFDFEIDQATKIFANQHGHSSFISALTKLHSELTSDLNKMKEKISYIEEISESDALTLLELTTEMLTALRQVDPKDINKKYIYAEIIEKYESLCREELDNSAYANLGKVLKATAMFLTGTFIGNQLINLGTSTTKLAVGGMAATASILGTFVFFKPSKYLQKIRALEETPINVEDTNCSQKYYPIKK